MKNWRVAGIDDSFSGDFCCLVCCVMSGRNIEGFMYEEIEVDGLDSTEKIVKMLRKSKFYKQLKVVYLNGITFGGFNVVDVCEVYERTGIPVVVVMNRMPRLEEFYEGLKNFKDCDKRLEIVKRAGEIKKVGNLFIQIFGIGYEDAVKMIQMNTFSGKIPETLRIAHLVASAVVHGESKNR
ncbi:MAG: DUF99 family protein [Archaeoglobaceae archaeon]